MNIAPPPPPPIIEFATPLKFAFRPKCPHERYQIFMWYAKYGHCVHVRVSKPARGEGESCCHFPISKNRKLKLARWSQSR